ncbi:HDIG domain-containing protein [Spirochaetia bacterium]|nr:HDIG domain-containing protein [Spirochaetia bacterium]
MGNAAQGEVIANIHPLLKEIAALFAAEGKEVYLVGGAVRDIFRGGKAQDWDLATNATPEEVIALFRRERWRVIPTGIRHGTVTVHYKGHDLEVTTFRTESDYQDGRHPEKVVYAATIEEDLSRRDFRMNAIALHLPDGEPVDPFGGRGDIKKKLIRCVGDPAERFTEDGLRPLRGVRFAAQLGFTFDPPTLDAIPRALPVTAGVSPERVRDELDKIIGSPNPAAAFRLMEQCGLLKLILPELADCRGVDQKGYHQFDVLDHSLLACDYAGREGYPLEVGLAALFHDIGKPAVRKLDETGIWTFYQHEKVSAEIAKKILTRLRYSNAQIDAVCHLIEEHMFHYEEIWSDAAVRRFIIRTGEENLENLYRLRLCDAYGMAGIEPGGDFLIPLLSRVDTVLVGSNAFSLKDLAVSGRDLLAAGVKPGKYIGIILNELLETVVDDPESNTREKLLEIAGNLNKRYI